MTSMADDYSTSTLPHRFLKSDNKLKTRLGHQGCRPCSVHRRPSVYRHAQVCAKLREGLTAPQNFETGLVASDCCSSFMHCS